MSLSQWLLALLVGLVAIETLAVVAAHRWGDGAQSEDETAVDTTAGVVECPDCGTENEIDYRYCRACVNELPGTPPLARGPTAPLSGFTR